MTKLTLMLTVSILILSQSISAAVSIIAHPDLPQNKVSSSMIRKIYLGKTSKWEDGSSIFPTILNGGKNHKLFLKKYTRKSPLQFNTFWKRSIFTGKGQPFKKCTSDSEVVEFIATHPGSIGYIDSESSHEGTEVLNIK